MRVNNEMSLFKVSINRNYKDNLLNQISKINNIHVKAKSDLKTVSELSSKSKHDKDSLEKIKKLRESATNLFKTLSISESDFNNLKVKEKEIFEGKDLEELLNHVIEELNFYANRINELERYISKATIELENINLIKSCYKFLENYNINRFNITYFKALGFRIYTTFEKNEKNLKNLFEFSVFPNIYQLTKISNERILFFVIFPQDKEVDLKERIRLIHAEEIQILKKYLMYDKINFSRIDKEIGFIEKTLSKYKLEIKRIREDNLLKFAAINEVILNLEEYNWVDLQFEEVSPTHLSLDFYIPIKNKTDVEKNLLKTFRDKITLESIDITKKPPVRQKKSKNKSYKEMEGEDGSDEKKGEKEGEDLRKDAPTIMKNLFFIRPFEAITRMYGTPSYSEIDPTPFLAITFPLLFGLMFGDIGHGICLIIAGFIGGILYRKREGEIKNISWVLFYCGWGAVLWGFMYGEFFGMHEMFGYHLSPIQIGGFTLYNPIENIITVFLFAVLIGVIHINLGWFIQFLNYWKQSQKYLGFTDSLMKIFLLTGGTVLLFVWGFDIYSWMETPYPILLPLIPGLLLILLKPFGRMLGVSYLKHESYGALLGEGSMETFETVLSVMSNVASYIRLLALALAHIALMTAIQAMVGLIPVSDNIFMIIIRIIGLIFGNIVVILLEGLLVFLNAIRLHFYEFFFKFYQGSGVAFFPFFLDTKFSIIVFKAELEKDVISEEIEKEMSVKVAKENIERAINYLSDKYLK